MDQISFLTALWFAIQSSFQHHDGACPITCVWTAQYQGSRLLQVASTRLCSLCVSVWHQLDISTSLGLGIANERVRPLLVQSTKYRWARQQTVASSVFGFLVVSEALAEFFLSIYNPKIVLRPVTTI